MEYQHTKDYLKFAKLKNLIMFLLAQLQEQLDYKLFKLHWQKDAMSLV